MSNKRKRTVTALPVSIGVLLVVFATMGLNGGLDGVIQVKKLKPLKPVPVAYSTKHMPKGWWTDAKIIKEGEEIFQGIKYGKNVTKDKRVKCAKCHGKDGKPKGKGPRDMRSAKRMSRMSDSYWFWRMSEGVPETKMKSWKALLTEEERWKVMAYEHMFSHDRKAEVHDHPEIEHRVAGAS